MKRVHSSSEQTGIEGTEHQGAREETLELGRMDDGGIEWGSAASTPEMPGAPGTLDQRVAPPAMAMGSSPAWQVPPIGAARAQGSRPPGLSGARTVHAQGTGKHPAEVLPDAMTAAAAGDGAAATTARAEEDAEAAESADAAPSTNAAPSANAAPTSLSSSVSDLRARVMNRLRQGNITRSDPLSFSPRIAHHGERLGFFHLYKPENDQASLQWLASPAYVIEAQKQHPIDACHSGISLFHAHLLAERQEQREATRVRFLDHVGRMLASGVSERRAGRDCFWLPHFDQVEEYATHHKPWAASMVQGWAAALFMRAHQLGGGERFVDAALRTTGLFFVPVEQGGVLDHLPHGLPCYEKYAFPGQVRHVLNGFMSSLFGLQDLARATGDATARELFEAGVATVSDERTLRAYDLGYTTRYDLASPDRATPSGVFYTWVHARQLAGLARITGSAKLRAWSERWRDYVFRRRHTLRASADVLLFRAKRLPTYAARFLG